MEHEEAGQHDVLCEPVLYYRQEQQPEEFGDNPVLQSHTTHAKKIYNATKYLKATANFCFK